MPHTISIDRCFIENLPNELLELVFEQLGHICRINLRMVNKRFSCLVTPGVFRDIHIGSGDRVERASASHRVFPSNANSLLVSFADLAVAPFVRRITLNFMPSYEAGHKISHSCGVDRLMQGLTSIKLYGCLAGGSAYREGAAGENLRRLLCAAQNVTTLDLRFLPFVTPFPSKVQPYECLLNVTCPKIRELSLRTPFIKIDVKAFILQHATTLRVLRLTDTEVEHDSWRQFLTDIAANCELDILNILIYSDHYQMFEIDAAFYYVFGIDVATNLYYRPLHYIAFTWQRAAFEEDS